ncbi:MAG: VWA domain-containing protein [Candidatus Dormibacteria bacterium]
MAAAFSPDWTLGALSFSSVVGQERMKLSLLLAAVDPRIGGVLIRGERGTAKSTLVRALASVLPVQMVVADCVYQCQPGEGYLCASCEGRRRAGEALPSVPRSTRVVELPLGASEDRVVGSIDMEQALVSGTRAFQPGVLAEANGQILYVDEVNLLDHHLVDVLLDAAAMGVNVVEREGISASHPARFILVGTMNPEEGDLRPQLLDRFGLCVDVRGLLNPVDRVRIMETDRWQERSSREQDEVLAANLLTARRLLPEISVPLPVIQMAATIAVDQQVVGHRADLVMVRAARAKRALRAAQRGEQGQLEVSLEDLIAVSELALVHRRRSLGGSLVPGEAGDVQASEPFQGGGSFTAEPMMPSAADASQPGPEAEAGNPAAKADGQRSGADAVSGPALGSSAPGEAEAVIVEESVPVARIQIPKERLRRHGAGRRSQTASKDRRGRYVGARVVERTTDLAIDATLRAAAPHQLARRQAKAPSDASRVQLEKRDLRQKVRQRRIGNLIVFLVDASASMDAEQRMDATRSAILALLKDAYVRRDRVAMICFSGRSARAVLRPTASVDLAERQLGRLAVGGTTPLTHGLVAALDLISSERLRDSEVLPLLVLISDGRGNISLRGEEPLVEAQRAAAMVRQEQIRALVIDSSRDHLGGPLGRAPGPSPRMAGHSFNACQDLAERMGAQYFGLFDVSEQGILRPVAEALRRQG